MNIINRNIPVQNINSPVIKANRDEKKEDIKDSVEISSGKTEEKDNLKKIKETFEKGTEAIISGAEKTSEYLENSPKTRNTLETLLQFFKTVKTFPKFIYPSLLKMTEAERKYVLEILDKLPLNDVGSVKSITMLESLPNASGGAGPIPASPFILLTRDNFKIGSDWAKEVLIHETGHAVDYNSGLFGLPKLFSESSKSPWGKGPYISDYAATGPGWYPSEWDDFAESYAYYHAHPEELKTQCPEKFKRIQELEKQGFFEKLVDNEAFRETGKYMGGIMEKLPFLHNGLAMVSLVGGFVQAYKALGEMKRAEKTGDEKLKMNATMNFAAGACFASNLLAVPGMAIEGAKRELNRSIGRGEITSEQANAVVDSTIGLIAGPMGKVANWIMARLPWNKTYEINQDDMGKLSEKLSPEKMEFINSIKDREFTKKELKQMLGKLNFTDEEIDLIKDNTRDKKITDSHNDIYKFTEETLKKLEGKLSQEKIDVLKPSLNKEINDKDMGKLLKKADFDKGDIALVRAYSEEIIKDETVNEDKDVGSLKRAASIGIGGATGALAGGFVGPYAGIMAGFAIGGPIGGIIGLVAGAIAGLQLGSYVGGRAGNLLGKALDHVVGEVKDHIAEKKMEPDKVN